MFYTYVLKGDERNDLYIGFTHDLRKRISEHNRGFTKTTKKDQWHCIYYEACLEERDARRREFYFKTSQGRRLLKRRLQDYFRVRRAS
ncbi:GIY-YIG nuclease family protein [Candidatus Kaiserbacteria bacterium]|nr:GIY-YIG nuclease family protein [Candidatus Kaiserbacteria bacterium]